MINYSDNKISLCQNSKPLICLRSKKVLINKKDSIYVKIFRIDKENIIFKKNSF